MTMSVLDAPRVAFLGENDAEIILPPDLLEGIGDGTVELIRHVHIEPEEIGDILDDRLDRTAFAGEVAFLVGIKTGLVGRSGSGFGGGRRAWREQRRRRRRSGRRRKAEAPEAPARCRWTGSLYYAWGRALFNFILGEAGLLFFFPEEVSAVKRGFLEFPRRGRRIVRSPTLMSKSWPTRLGIWPEISTAGAPATFIRMVKARDLSAASISAVPPPADATTTSVSPKGLVSAATSSMPGASAFFGGDKQVRAHGGGNDLLVLRPYRSRDQSSPSHPKASEGRVTSCPG